MQNTFYFLENKQERNLLDKYFVLDIETFKGLKATPDAFWFCCLYGNNFKKVFYSVEEIKQELLQRKYRGKYIFAHNAEYDLSGIYGNIYKNLDKNAIFNGKFICASNGNVTFGDSHNIIQGSVESIGESIGIKKIMVYTKTTNKTSKKPKITDKEINGCFRDCEIIYKALEKIFSFCGELKLTIGSLSMNYFRRNFLTETIIHNDDYDKYFFESYFGGRVEALQLGRVNAFKYDFNSMYPHIMRDIILPHPNHFKKIVPTTKNFLNNFINKEGLISATIKHRKNKYGYLPVRQNEEVIFPVGKFKGVWNMNEFRFAVESKMILIEKIHYVVYSEKIIKNLFTKFVDILYNKRLKEKNLINKILLKNLLNNLYGKFGTKTKPKTHFIDDLDESLDFLEELETKGVEYKLLKTGKHFLCEVYFNHKEQFSIPSIASYITSGARIHLLKAFQQYENYDIVYCDTDSIAVRKKLPIENSLILGELKLEKEKILTIKGNKHYIELIETKKGLKQLLKLKGIPKNHEYRQDENGKWKYYFNRMTKTKEGLRDGRETGVFEEHFKEIKKSYTKRKNNLPLNLK